MDDSSVFSLMLPQSERTAAFCAEQHAALWRKQPVSGNTGYRGSFGYGCRREASAAVFFTELRKGGRHEKTKNISDAVLVPVPVQHGLYGLCDRAGYDHTADHQTHH